MAVGLNPGHEVVTTPFTSVTTAEMIVLLGAKPVFVDVEPDACNKESRRPCRSRSLSMSNRRTRRYSAESAIPSRSRLARGVLSLPMHPHPDEPARRRVADAVRASVSDRRAPQ